MALPLDFRKGAVSAHLQGTLLLEVGNRVQRDFAGDFNGEAVDLHLYSDGSRLRGGSDNASFDLETLTKNEKTATARLWLSPESELPLVREQTLEFSPGSEMLVIEHYERFQLIEPREES